MSAECMKCKMWDMAAKENGYHSGMCEECFNLHFVLLKTKYNKEDKVDGRCVNPDLGYHCIENVTHWMPPPPPPKGG